MRCPNYRGLRASGPVEGAAGVCSARLPFRGSPPRSLGVQCRTAVTRHLQSEEHEVRGQRKEHGERHVRGPSERQDRGCTKGLSCGVGGEHCHVVTVMRDFVGTCQRTQKAGWEFHLILGRRPQGPLRKCKLATPGGQACGCDRFTEAAPGRRASVQMRREEGGTGGGEGLAASREVGRKPQRVLYLGGDRMR